MKTITHLAAVAGLAVLVANPLLASAACPSIDRDKASCNASTNGSWEGSWFYGGWQDWQGKGILDYKAGKYTELAVGAKVEHDTCSGSTQTSMIKATATQTDSTAYSFGVELSTGATAGLNVPLLAKLEISGTQKFTGGLTKTTSIAKSVEHSVSVTTPPYKHLSYKLVVVGMEGGTAQLGIFRNRTEWGRCCFSTWIPGTSSCGPWKEYVCETENKTTWSDPAKQSLTNAEHFVKDNKVADCPDEDDSPVDSPIDSPVDSPIDSPIDSPVDSPIDSPSDSPIATDSPIGIGIH